MDEQETQNQQAYKVQLDFFEGPLDLLLHLVKQHELEIFDIPVAFIAEKYLEYLDLMRTLNLDVAGEFLLMAATLAHIKSREMLPPSDEDDDDDDSEEGEDPKKALIRRLLEYQKYKDAAQRLGDMPQLNRRVWTHPTGSEDADKKDHPLAEVGLFKLLEAFNDVLVNAKPDLSHDVVVDRVSLATRISQLADHLREAKRLTFVECFKAISEAGDPETRKAVRMNLVTTLLAILEMARLRMIRVRQASPEGEIYLESTDDDTEVESEALEDLQVDDAYE